jgi:signal transduction histidine kinase
MRIPQLIRWLRSAIDVAAPRGALAAERAARQAAEQARDHWMGIFTALPVAVFVYRGREHRIEAVTGQSERTFGRQLVGRTNREAFSDLEGQGWFEKLDQVFDSGEALQVHAGRCLLRNAAGVSIERFLDVKYEARRDARGEVFGVTAISIDVTAQVHARRHSEESRRDAEAARLETEVERQRLSHVLAQAPFGVAVVAGPERRLRVVNENLRRLIGQKNALGMTLSEAFPELEMQGVHRNVDTVFESGETLVLREQAMGWDRTGNGSVQGGVFDAIYQPIRTASGEIEAVLVFTVDVSAGLRARQAVDAAYDEAERARTEAETAREYLRNVLAAVPAAIAMFKGEDFVFEFANPAYVELVGGRTLLGLNVIDAFPDIPPEVFLARLQRVFSTGQIERQPEVRAVFDRDKSGKMSEGFFSTILGPLRTADGSIGGVVAATLDVTEHVHQRQRVSALHREAEAARAELQGTHAQLETRIAARTAELAETNRALGAEIAERKRAEHNRRELSRRLASAREDEQRRLARDLHDQVGQTLTALTLAVQAARSDATLTAATRERLADAQRLADELAQDVHNLAVRLRPTVLDDLGLQAALAQLLSDFAQRSHVAADFQTAGLEVERLSSEVETVLYRVVQEAITNVARHARASHVTVIVELHAGCAIAVVEDDGVGYDAETTVADKRLGLVGMRERVQLAGGRLEVESELGRGTTVIARLPVANAVAVDALQQLGGSS